VSHDFLYDAVLQGRRVQPAESPSSLTAEVRAARPEESAPRAPSPLEPPPPLAGIPREWIFETQRIVFRLFPQEEMQRSDSLAQCLAFVGLTPKVGVTAISYLVAYHLTSERSDRGVLFAQFISGPGQASSSAGIEQRQIGDPLAGDFWSAQQALTVVSIGSQPGLSVGEGKRWIQEFVQKARTHFRWVILDIRPFSQASESYVAARASDGVVLIVKSGESRYPTLNSLCSELAALGIQVRGVVLNFRKYPIPDWLMRYL
jgi:hypothetical protein